MSDPLEVMQAQRDAWRDLAEETIRTLRAVARRCGTDKVATIDVAELERRAAEVMRR